MHSILYVLGFIVATALCDDNPAILYIVTNQTNTSQHVVLTETRSLQLNLKLDTVIAVHGWKGDVTWAKFPVLATAFFKRGPCNFIIVDWGKYAKAFYWDAIINSEKVSKYVAEYVANLTRRGLSESRVHLIGHSLGAHLVGNVGSVVTKTTGKKVERITGLDPAGPLFGLAFARLRLSSSDAKVVVVVHTDAGYNGYVGSLGTSDFYANGGGSPQPECNGNSNEDGCSHQISAAYFAESVNSNGFVGKKCEQKLLGLSCNDSNTAIFGPNTPASVTGTYYFNTNAKSPYAQG